MADQVQSLIAKGVNDLIFSSEGWEGRVALVCWLLSQFNFLLPRSTHSGQMEGFTLLFQTVYVLKLCMKHTVSQNGMY